jgi:hypothetical protein
MKNFVNFSAASSVNVLNHSDEDAIVSTKYADVAVSFMQAHDSQTPIITPEQDTELSRK